MNNIKKQALCLLATTSILSSTAIADNYITSIEYLRDSGKYPPKICEMDLFTMAGLVQVEFLLSDLWLPKEVCDRAKQIGRKFEKDLSRWNVDTLCGYVVVGTGNDRSTGDLAPGCNKTSRIKKNYQLDRRGNTWECDGSVSTSTPTDGRYPLHITTQTHFSCQLVDYGVIFTSEEF
ncbi:hypothetical protein [Algicola sagamiensis]|uniref:hypothetical protein n=1 Tax=Algicola sagamiensis TaxID=163869 RepID=UPI000372DB77|nr:hypothetical protein [Algicola sagamiensis]